ncbi:hypothetical protein [Streptomyces sp. ADI96-02]|uniref:hypothetical protein n=1 Tax=Streptomyces sp. ADI96-02 TaxID=1522760 RepID=UPI0019D12C07|nr:hypothetical protein [Streptomyces sp. ADI96-02]
MRQRLAVEDPAADAVEVAVVRAAVTAAPAGIAVLRLIGMLPAHWVCGQRIEEDRITLRVRGGDGPEVRGRCGAVLRDRALEGWALETPEPADRPPPGDRAAGTGAGAGDGAEDGAGGEPAEP